MLSYVFFVVLRSTWSQKISITQYLIYTWIHYDITYTYSTDPPGATMPQTSVLGYSPRQLWATTTMWHARDTTTTTGEQQSQTAAPHGRYWAKSKNQPKPQNDQLFEKEWYCRKWAHAILCPGGMGSRDGVCVLFRATVYSNIFFFFFFFWTKPMN